MRITQKEKRKNNNNNNYDHRHHRTVHSHKLGIYDGVFHRFSFNVSLYILQLLIFLSFFAQKRLKTTTQKCLEISKTIIIISSSSSSLLFLRYIHTYVQCTHCIKRIVYAFFFYLFLLFSLSFHAYILYCCENVQNRISTLANTTAYCVLNENGMNTVQQTISEQLYIYIWTHRHETHQNIPSHMHKMCE